MTIADVILFTILACTFVASLGIIMIRKDIEELKELIKRYDTRRKSKTL